MPYRKATVEDAKPLKSIATRVVSANYTPFLGEEMVSEFINSGASDAEIDAGLENCIIMEIDGQVVGFAIIRGDLLHLLMVDVPFQRKGFGTRLLQYAEDLLFKANRRIRLQTFKENTAATTFYFENGWRAASEQWIPELNKVMINLSKALQ